MVRLRAAAASDVGRYRSANQDAAFTASWGAGVADGVGGGPSGDLASAALIHRLMPTAMPPIDAESLGVRIRLANWDLRAHAERDPRLRGMATTFTGLFLGADGRLLLAHTGDSRAYLLRRGVLYQRTRDDSYVQALVDSGLMTVADAASHPHRNVITASLCGSEGDVVRVTDHDAFAGDRWMLCSDGLTDVVDDARIAAILGRTADAEEAAWTLVHEALDADSRDNVTAVVADVCRGAADHHESATFAGSAASRFAEQLDA